MPSRAVTEIEPSDRLGSTRRLPLAEINQNALRWSQQTQNLDPKDETLSLIHNERTKLTAAWLNAVSGGAMAAGVIAPLAATFYGVSSAPISSSILMIGAATWFLAGIGLHLAARYTLRNLKP
jgi:hypothetical protein